MSETIKQALQELLVAVKYGGLTELPNGAGRGYISRIPDTFVEIAEKAVAEGV